MKKKFVEVTFDGLSSIEYPIEWINGLVDEKRFFMLLGIYEKEVEED